MLAAAAASCLITLMAVFLGASSRALGITLLLQVAIIPIAIITYLYYTWKGAQRIGLSDLFLLYRRMIPGWMWFVFWSVNSLVIAGEASLILTSWASEQKQIWLHHAPLVCAFTCSMALLACYMWTRIKHPEFD